MNVIQFNSTDYIIKQGQKRTQGIDFMFILSFENSYSYYDDVRKKLIVDDSCSYRAWNASDREIIMEVPE